jgi:hypothetical protein
VEQHISGSSDPVHKGEHGPDHREEIEAGMDPGDDPGDGPGTDSDADTGAVSVDNPRSGGPPSEDRDSTEREVSTVPAPSDGGDDVEQGDDQDGGGLLGVVVLIVAMIALGAISPNGAGQTAPRHPLQP